MPPPPPPPARGASTSHRRVRSVPPQRECPARPVACNCAPRSTRRWRLSGVPRMAAARAWRATSARIACGAAARRCTMPRWPCPARTGGCAAVRRRMRAWRWSRETACRWWRHVSARAAALLAGVLTASVSGVCARAEEGWSVTPLPASRTWMRLQGLQVGAWYVVRVRARNCMGDSAWTEGDAWFRPRTRRACAQCALLTRR